MVDGAQENQWLSLALVLAKVGVEDSNPFARSNLSTGRYNGSSRFSRPIQRVEAPLRSEDGPSLHWHRARRGICWRLNDEHPRMKRRDLLQPHRSIPEDAPLCRRVGRAALSP